MASLDAGLHRNRHRNEIDPARRELIAKADDRFHRIGLHGCCARAMAHDLRFEEGWARHVIDVGSVKEPAIAPEINLFVPGAEFYERELDAGQEPFGNNGFGFELFLGGFQFGRAREQTPYIARSARAADFFPGGISFVDVESSKARL